ncbi:MAG TPA: acyltransferase family protein, partial [Tepidisphaeraceae bacterium]
HLGAVPLSPGMLWKGVEYHLWFLPFLFAWSVLLAGIHTQLLRRSDLWRWPLIILFAVAGLAFALTPMPSTWDELFDNPTYAYVQGWRALPAASWAMAFALLMTSGPTVYRVSTLTGLAGAALTVACAVKQARYGIQLIPRGLSGLGSMLLALMPWPHGPAVSLLARWGRFSYGIYLCHVLVVEIVRVVGGRLHLSVSPAVDLAIFALGFGGSLVLVLFLGRFPRLAWLNG